MDASKIIGGGATGAGIGAAAVYVTGQFGVNLTPEDGALIATAATAVVAFVAHNGIRGALRAVWHGGSTSPTPPPST